MKVNLISYTDNARELLIFSKKTRLEMSVLGFENILLLKEEEKEKELTYVFSTIGSSLEFVDYVFMIEDVTRAFTHQLVRHRVGISFAQQSMRTVDMSDFKYYTPPGMENNDHYHDGMEAIKLAYKDMILEGVKPEDARGVLPTNIYTNILMKINLRSLIDMMRVRLCLRVQKEFRDVMVLAREKVNEVHPWAAKNMEVSCLKSGYCMFPRHLCERKNGKGEISK